MTDLSKVFECAQVSADVSQLMGTLTSLPQQLATTLAPLLDSRDERLQEAVRAEIGTGLVRMAFVSTQDHLQWSSHLRQTSFSVRI